MIRTYSRFPYRPSYTYRLLYDRHGLMCWEGQRADAAIASGNIPKDSIRLRILANSDDARIKPLNATSVMLLSLRLTLG